MKIKSLFLFLIVNFSYSQDIAISIKKSEVFKEEEQVSKLIIKKKELRLIPKLIYSENIQNGGFINVEEIKLGRYPKKYVVECFNSELKLIKKVTLNLDERSVIKGVKITNDIIELIVFKYDKLKRFIVVNVLTSTIDDLSFTEKEIFVLNQETYKKYFGKPIEPFFININFREEEKNNLKEFKFSLNKKFMVLTFDSKDQSHLFFVFDNDFKLIYHKAFSLDLEKRFYEYQDLQVDNSGNVYLLVEKHENNSTLSKKKGELNYHYTLYDLSKDKERKLKVLFKDYLVNSLSLVLYEKKINLLGFYGNKKKNKLSGVCTFIINKDKLTLSNQKFAPFTKQFMNDKFGDKKHKDIKDVKFKSIFRGENGNILINAEEQYETSSSYPVAGPGGGFQSNAYGRTTEHFDDILTVKLNSEGDILWARNINKSQTGINGSFTSTFINNEVYYFINTTDKVKKLSNERINFKNPKLKESNLYVIKIDEKGKLNYKKIIDYKDSEVWYRVSDQIVFPDLKTIIFLGFKKKKKQILKVSID